MSIGSENRPPTKGRSQPTKTCVCGASSGLARERARILAVEKSVAEKERRVGDLREYLAEIASKVDAEFAALQARRASHSQAQAELEEKRRVLDVVAERTHARRAALEAEAAGRARQLAQRAKRAARADRRAARLAEQERQLSLDRSAVGAEALALQQALEAARQRRLQLQADIALRERANEDGAVAAFDAAESAAAAAREALAPRQDRLRRQDREMSCALADIDARRRTAEAQEAEINETRTASVALHEEVQEREAAVAEKERQVSEATAALAAREKMLEQADRELAAREAALPRRPASGVACDPDDLDLRATALAAHEESLQESVKEAEHRLQRAEAQLRAAEEDATVRDAYRRAFE